jgi:hypothetical protein
MIARVEKAEAADLATGICGLAAECGRRETLETKIRVTRSAPRAILNLEIA